jgi:hypothetical protein
MSDYIPGAAVTRVKIGDRTDRGEVAAVRTTEYTDRTVIEVRLRLDGYPAHVFSNWTNMRLLKLEVN